MVVRVKKQREAPFVILERATLRMESLSFKARGLWAFCMTYPDDWEFHPQHMALGSDHDGLTAVRSALKELVGVGLAYLERVRSENGTVHGSRWVIYETSVLNPHRDEQARSHSTHRDAGFPESGKTRNPVNTGSRQQPKSGRPGRLRSKVETRMNETLPKKQQANTRVPEASGEEVVHPGDMPPPSFSTRRGVMLPAAASLINTHAEKAELILQLVARGVDKTIAEKLAARARREHVAAMLCRGETEAEGPGWYVRAIEDGYRSNEGRRRRAAKRYTHTEALTALAKKGITLNEQHPFGKYFDTHRANGTVYFVPTDFFG